MLWEPVSLRGVTVPNRLVCAPMCTRLADPHLNEVSDAHLVHYGALAMGGSGLVIVEATAVERRGRIYLSDLGLWDDRFIKGHRKLTDLVHTTSHAKIGIQLNHAGRKANTTISPQGQTEYHGTDHPLGDEFVSSSPVPWDKTAPTPRELTVPELQEIKESFVQAAKRAVVAGYDLIEVHAAHGYLLSQFSSPEVNRRTDKYGGSTLNRLRFPLEVIEAIRNAVPADFPISVRISATDWTDGGFTMSDSVVYASKMKALGVDVCHVSTGGVAAHQKVPWERPFYQLPFALAIKEQTGMPVVTVGGYETVEVATELAQKVDFVAMGRKLLRDPYFPRAAAGSIEKCPPPKYQMPAFVMSERKKAAIAEKENLPELNEAPANVMCSLKLCGWLGTPRA